jgi:hypothetical protein
VRIQLRNLFVAEVEVVSPTEGRIWATGMRGCQEPPESLARGTLPRILQELGKAFSFPPAKSGMVHLTIKNQASVGMGAATEGANEHLAEEEAGHQGRPETAGGGREGLL